MRWVAHVLMFREYEIITWVKYLNRFSLVENSPKLSVAKKGKFSNRAQA